jgi:hypothetical protein
MSHEATITINITKIEISGSFIIISLITPMLFLSAVPKLPYCRSQRSGVE